MTKKERQGKINFLNKLINEKREFTEEQEKLINNFIFNILVSDTVINRYSYSKYGNIAENKTITLYDCINYLGNKLKESD